MSFKNVTRTETVSKTIRVCDYCGEELGPFDCVTVTYNGAEKPRYELIEEHFCSKPCLWGAYYE